jgi:hypothetical protein
MSVDFSKLVRPVHPAQLWRRPSQINKGDGMSTPAAPSSGGSDVMLNSNYGPRLFHETGEGPKTFNGTPINPLGVSGRFMQDPPFETNPQLPPGMAAARDQGFSAAVRGWNGTTASEQTVVSAIDPPTQARLDGLSEQLLSVVRRKWSA